MGSAFLVGALDLRTCLALENSSYRKISVCPEARLNWLPQKHAIPTVHTPPPGPPPTRHRLWPHTPLVPRVPCSLSTYAGRAREQCKGTEGNKQKLDLAAKCTSSWIGRTVITSDAAGPDATSPTGRAHQPQVNTASQDLLSQTRQFLLQVPRDLY